jgi:hypothetical protein
MSENDQKEPGAWDIIKGFPVYFGSYVFGFVWGGLTDVTLTSLWIGSAAFGYATSSWAIGVAAFFLGHFTIRIANARGQAIVRSGREVRVPLGRIANILLAFVPPEPTEGEVTPETPSEANTPAT